MSKPEVNITQINLVAKNFDQTLAFYRLVGFDIPTPANQPLGALHAKSSDVNGFVLEIDNEHLARIYNAGFRRGVSDTRLIIGLTFVERDRVDATYCRLVAAGHQRRQQPYDAFWGSRYAIVADPEGNEIALMSEPDASKRHWPPTNSPD